MQKIYKYLLYVNDIQRLELPRGAEILTVQTQDGVPCLWALVYPDNPTETRVIEIFGTGHPIETDVTNRKYIATFQLAEGKLVFHVFEKIEEV